MSRQVVFEGQSNYRLIFSGFFLDQEVSSWGCGNVGKPSAGCPRRCGQAVCGLSTTPAFPQPSSCGLV